MKNFYKNKKVLITGHTGFKGSWLTQTLISWNANVVGISLEPHTEPSLFSVLNLEEKINNYFVNIHDFDEIKKIIKKEKPEIIIHLAGQAIVRKSYDDPLETIKTNTLGTANILEVIRRTDFIKSAVFITTDKVYEPKEIIYPYREIDELGGNDLYSASKSGSDIITKAYIKSFFNPKKYNKEHNTLVGIGRSGNVIGGGDWSEDRLIPDLIRSIFEDKKELEIRSPKAIRPWQHVLETISGYLLLSKKLYEGKVEFSGPFNFGPEDESLVTVEELIKKAIDTIRKGSYKIKEDNTKPESKILKLDITKSKSILNWSPKLSLEENIKYTFEWYDNFYNNSSDINNFTNKQINNFFS